ncbi:MULTISPECIES: sensor histidine kinase [Pseudorhizobium]|uniref:histidine kinase n=1 Tax=Pseudorhizobium pelagicum TaxID=1509405 RepID=A0A922T7Y3_9HYPH|nr:MULTISPECIES: ATP-binding protein [Pseudorhizobium]KEQ06567.1 histidine kinase [Pseudorhizobium pelagicum]KEQ09723.1 histidine kinase [Pseudorhizobium pelagicum]MDY6960785.1 CHASE3 domain-containing protein [Pseudomonadota bacterium]|tara:strand:+ start:5348 stop:6847 length:1500 start_codon:yes stop_codon:yes gene_type:complete
MPHKTNTFARSSILMLLIGAAILVGIVLSSLFQARMTQSYFTTVVELRNARAASADMLVLLQAAETGQRGFLLTQNENFLEPYQRSMDELGIRMERLKATLDAEDSVVDSVSRIEYLITEKLTELRETVAMAQAGDVAGAVAVVRAEYGRQVMEEAQDLLRSLIAALDLRLNEGVEELSSSAVSMQWFAIGGGIVIIAVVGGAILIVMQHVRALSRAQSAVEELNASLEERVEERTEDLMQANREIQRYAYIVSHDLRAPLVNIMGFTSELDTTLSTVRTYILSDGDRLTEDEIREARVAVEEDLPEAIGFIRSSTKKMDGLINAILKISRDGRRELKPEPIDLSELLENTAASIYHQVDEAGGEIRIAVGGAKGLISDRFSLEQIFGNLFDNAVKYRHPDRPLHLAVRAMPAKRNGVRIEVEDNGRGVAPEDHERIFELFRRSGVQDKTGEGIGLAHVRSLVRNLGGEITVTSTLGGGSTFIIRLPGDLSQYVRSNGS